MAVVSTSRKLTVLVLLTNGVMLAINAVSSMYIARHLGVNSFANYSTMVSFATVFGISLRGLQFLMVDDYSAYRPNTVATHPIHGPKTIITFLFQLGLILAVLSPVIATILDISIGLFLIGIMIILSFGLQSSAAGKYLGLGRFGRLQAFLTLGTCLQLPLLFIGGLKSLGTSFFLSILIVPSLLIWLMVEVTVNDIKVTVTRMSWKNIFETGFNLGIAALSTNTYLLLAGDTFRGDQRGALSGLAIILTTATGLAISMSMLLSRETSVDRRRTGTIPKLHNIGKYILFCSIVPTFGFLIVALNQAPIKWIFGAEFSGVLTNTTLIFATLGFVPWGFVSVVLFDRGPAYSIKKFMPISIVAIMNCLLLVLSNPNASGFIAINGSLGLLAAALILSINV